MRSIDDDDEIDYKTAVNVWILNMWMLRRIEDRLKNIEDFLEWKNEDFKKGKKPGTGAY